MTVLVSSHLLAEVEQVATHVGIMAGGRLLPQGTLAEVLSTGSALVTVTTPDAALAEPRRCAGSGWPSSTARPTGSPSRLGDVPVERVAAAVVGAGARRCAASRSPAGTSRTCSSR